MPSLTPTVTVVDDGGTFDGSTFLAVAQVAGEDGVPGDTLEGVAPTVTYFAGSNTSGNPLSGAPSQAGTYTALATFPGSADYTSAIASVTFTITQATPLVFVYGQNADYTGSPDPVNVSIEGIDNTSGPSLEGVSPTLDYVQLDSSGNVVDDLGSTVPTLPGIYNATASFAGSTDYSAATGGGLGDVSATFTINTPVDFSSSSYRVYETAGNAVITVNLAEPSSATVTVAYATSDGTAVAGANYTATSGTLTFAAGQTSATFSVPVLNDNGQGGTYPLTVNLALTNASNATIGSGGTAQLNIDDLVWTNGPSFGWTQTSAPAPSITNPGDQANAEGDTVSLPISASDPNNAALCYAADNLPPGLGIDPSSGIISGTVSSSAAQYFGGVYPTTIVVTNADGGSVTTSFNWTIAPVYAPPTVTSPGNQTSTAGSTISLPISASQAQGDAVVYDTSGLPSGLTIDSSSGIISGTIELSAASATPYTVSVLVMDDASGQIVTASTSFQWTVNLPAPSVSLTNPGNQSNSVGDYVDLPLTASDSDDNALTFTVNTLPAGLAMDPNSGEITGVVASSAHSTTPYSITVTASDGSASSSMTFSWVVSAVSLTPPGDQGNLDGDTVNLPLSASDASGGTVSYTAAGLPPGLSISASTGVISGTLSSTADVNSPYQVTVTANDGTYSSIQAFNWAVADLSLTAPSNQASVDGQSISVQLVAQDNVATPSYSVTGLPSGLTVDPATGLISGTLAAGDFADSPYQVTVTADDGSASSSQSFVWTVSPAIALVSPGPQANAAGDSVSIDVSASEPGNNAFSFTSSNLPAGLSIDSATGAITGTISASAVGSSPYQVTVTASDGTYTSSQTFPWTVSTLYLASPGDQSNLDDDSVSLPLTESYHGSGTVQYSAVGLPGGLTIDPNSGLISGTIADTADVNGPYTVTVSASDGSDPTVSQTFTWQVAPRITIAAIADQTSVPGDSGSIDVSAVDAAGSTPTYSASGLPSGVTIDPTTGIISGTITAVVSSTPDVVTVSAADGTSTVSASFNWSIVPITLVNPGNGGSVGSATVSMAMQADVASGYTASYTAVGLPPGLAIDSGTGVISGTLDSGDTGNTYTVTVTADDGVGDTRKPDVHLDGVRDQHREHVRPDQHRGG